jgi:hypothetical protein
MMPARQLDGFEPAKDRRREHQGAFMRLTIEMAAVGECEVTECSYNVGSSCHARAITIGSGLHPACDTYLRGIGHVADASSVAGVGACKVTGCRYNEDLECQLPSIAVAHHADHADCATYAPRIVV